tara:strand:+ start:27407 stop:28447 length:1041 start_codon:yes stop_codon:yes gene_type:complete
MKIIVTGGAGFIGGALVRHIINNTNHSVLNLDKLTYAGNLDSLKSISSSSRYTFRKLDICDQEVVQECVNNFEPNYIMHLAAESHVDRSIHGPAEFIRTNIFGTFSLLQCANDYYHMLNDVNKSKFRFHHISTDEVYGDLGKTKDLFKETTPYSPSSPYSASKASSDHLVRAWTRTYALPTIITNCSNNYGPYHFPEKLIPNTILSAINGQPIKIYGEGSQIRDWLFVEDHVKGLLRVVEKGEIGETYNIGGNNEKKNIQVVKKICNILEKCAPSKKPEGIMKYEDLITYVDDRPGHDIRYAIDSSKIQKQLNWKPIETFESGLLKTVKWYLENPSWWEKILSLKV